MRCYTHRVDHPFGSECPGCRAERLARENADRVIESQNQANRAAELRAEADREDRRVLDIERRWDAAGAEWDRMNPGDFQCPSCRYRTLRRDASRCPMCQGVVGADYWAAVREHERRQAETQAAKRAAAEEQWRSEAPARAAAAARAAEEAAREAARKKADERRATFALVYYAWLCPAIVMLCLGLVITTDPEARPGLERTVNYWKGWDGHETVFMLLPGFNLLMPLLMIPTAFATGTAPEGLIILVFFVAVPYLWRRAGTAVALIVAVLLVAAGLWVRSAGSGASTTGKPESAAPARTAARDAGPVAGGDNRLEELLSELPVELVGESFNQRASWPMLVRITTRDQDEVSGEVEWPGLSAIHLMKGIVRNGELVIREVDYIRKGNALLGCTYRLRFESASRLEGSFGGCSGTTETGSTRLARK